MNVLMDGPETRKLPENPARSARPIEFIPNQSFHRTTEADLAGEDVEFYEQEDEAPGALNPDTIVFGSPHRASLYIAETLPLSGL